MLSCYQEYRRTHPFYREREKERMRRKRLDPEYRIAEAKRIRTYREISSYRRNRDRMLSRVWHQTHKRSTVAYSQTRKLPKQLKRLMPFCEICGSTRNLENHHPDYSKPEVLLTLCKSCHRQIHALATYLP